MTSTQQSVGHNNHIKNIAIVGASGRIGKQIAKALLAKSSFEITAITQQGSNSVFFPGIRAVPIDYDDPSTIVEALKGQDALIITLSIFASKDTQAKLIRAAADAGVPYIMPNEFGMGNTTEAQLETVGPGKEKDRELIESLGVSSWIGLTCGFWYEHSLSGPGLYGIDIAKREVVFFDDGLQRLNTSTWAQVGRGVAELLSLPVLPQDEQDKSLTLSAYRNHMVYISSFAISQRDMFASLKRVTGTDDVDWTISSVPAKQRFLEAREKLKEGDRSAFGIFLYTRYFFPGEDAGFFEVSRGLD
ncbi:NAD(P)-binding protein, partial [Dothidotthia symphoricarpi CBS 119687]